MQGSPHLTTSNTSSHSEVKLLDLHLFNLQRHKQHQPSLCLIFASAKCYAIFNVWLLTLTTCELSIRFTACSCELLCFPRFKCNTEPFQTFHHFRHLMMTMVWKQHDLLFYTSTNSLGKWKSFREERGVTEVTAKAFSHFSCIIYKLCTISVKCMQYS